MSTATSNKRQRVESPAQYVPYDTQDLPQNRDLADQPWTRFEVNPTEAQITELVGKFDESDVRRLLIETIGDLGDSGVRKLLVNAAVSSELGYMRLCNELTYTQLLRKDEKAQTIIQQRSRPIEFAPQVHRAQKAIVPKQPEPSKSYEHEIYRFEGNVAQVDYIINEKWARLSGTKQYNKAWDAADMVNSEIAKIAQSITKKSNRHTKINAILGLCEIGSIVAEGGDCIGAEVRKHVGYDDTLVNTMKDIVKLMTIDEKRFLCQEDIDFLEAFDKKRKGYCVFDDFPEVLDTFKKAVAKPQGATHDLDDDEDDYGDIDEQALLNKSDAIEGSASQPITI